MSSQRYGVIICSRCFKPRVADLMGKTAKCSSCGKSLSLKKMRLYGNADNPQELIPIVGELNHKRVQSHNLYPLSREIGTLEQEKGGAKENDSDPGIDDDLLAGKSTLPPSRIASIQPKNKIDLIKEELDGFDEFSLQDFELAVSTVGWKREKAVQLLKDMMDAGEIYSPRRGSFKLVQ